MIKTTNNKNNNNDIFIIISLLVAYMIYFAHKLFNNL